MRSPYSSAPTALRRAVLVIACAASSVLLALAPAHAARPKSAPKAATTKDQTGLAHVEKQVQEFQLANGLDFIVVERHQAPVFSFMTVVDAGSADDQVGTTGLAHMMEHMAFKGTPIVGTKDYAKEKQLMDGEEKAWDALLDERRKGLHADTTKLHALGASFKSAQESAREPIVSNEFSKIIEGAGGQNMNAFTAEDITAYFYSMPSNQLELWALMEGSRMTYPVFREFYKERDVVIEERRMRYESSPLGRLFLEFITTAYAAHPYGFGGIGHASDLNSFTRTEGDEFFRKHYVAKNMTVAVVGDVTVADVKKYAEKYFAELSNAPKPPPLDTVEPEQKAERRVILQDPGQPIILIGYHIPAGDDPKYPAYKALGDLLGGGEFARLNKVLVKEKKIVTQIQAGPGFPGEKYPSLFAIFAIPAAGQDPLQVEQEIYKVLDEVKAKPFTADEVEGYKTRVRAQKIGEAETNNGLASALSQAQAVYGDWREFFRDQVRTQTLKPQDVIDAMQRSLVPSNRTVGIIENQTASDAQKGGR
jgi:predicted Zn-dependent peptidase